MAHLSHFSKPVLQFLFKVLLTSGVLWLVFRGIDLEHFGHIFYNQNHILILVASLLLAVQFLIGGWRWWVVTHALDANGQHSISLWQSQRFYYISTFFSNCLPGTVGGDMMRVWMLRERKIPFSQAINSVIIDRMVALFSMVVMVVIMLPYISSVMELHLGIIYSLIFLLAIVGLAVLIWSERLLVPCTSIKPLHWLLHFIRSLKLILGRRLLLVFIVLISLISHMCYASSVYVIAQSLGIPITVLQCMAFIPLVMLLTVLPISIGGWGVREASMVGLLGVLGIRQEAALMLSIEMGLLGMILTLPASALWLFQKKHVLPAT